MYRLCCQLCCLVQCNKVVMSLWHCPLIWWQGKVWLATGLQVLTTVNKATLRCVCLCSCIVCLCVSYHPSLYVLCVRYVRDNVLGHLLILDKIRLHVDIHTYVYYTWLLQHFILCLHAEWELMLVKTYVWCVCSQPMYIFRKRSYYYTYSTLTSNIVPEALCLI